MSDACSIKVCCCSVALSSIDDSLYLTVVLRFYRLCNKIKSSSSISLHKAQVVNTHIIQADGGAEIVA
jgi:hypothetical protein